MAATFQVSPVAAASDGFPAPNITCHLKDVIWTSAVPVHKSYKRKETLQKQPNQTVNSYSMHKTFE